MISIITVIITKELFEEQKKNDLIKKPSNHSDQNHYWNSLWIGKEVKYIIENKEHIDHI